MTRLKDRFVELVSITLVIASLLSIVIWGNRSSGSNQVSHTASVILKPKSANEIIEFFDGHQYSWPPDDYIVPNIVVKDFPGDMNTLSIDEKKAVFFRLMLPLVMRENQRILEERSYLIKLSNSGNLGYRQLKRLSELASKYGVEGGVSDAGVLTVLSRRIDVIPPAIVLAQAANESAWGTSRFAREANNIFGEWTYKKSQGIVPKKRGAGKKHYIRKFADIEGSLSSYMNNLNRGHAYKKFRLMRSDMRSNHDSLDALQLVTTLKRYSSRGSDYIAEIKKMILQNSLLELSKARFGR